MVTGGRESNPRCVLCFLGQNKECRPPQRTEARSQSPELQPALQELVRRLVEVSQAAAATAPSAGGDALPKVTRVCVRVNGGAGARRAG